MKALFKNLLLLTALATLTFLSCDSRTEDEKWQAEIRYFFMQHNDDYRSYEPVSFQKIDLAYLESQEPIQKALLVLQDTTKMRVKELQLARLFETADEVMPFAQKFSIDQIDDYIKIKASVEGALKRKGNEASEAYQQALRQEENALNLLSDVLSHFNLSIYSIDFANDPVIYFHEYLLDYMPRSAVFELNRESAEVISFREVS
ncbi:hypothetical protein [Roseivirga sp.]|uniref:hypothetical protein n=1 Tax=Roseivirga sp. TaxID=1964215 RepID=UPI003B52E36E